MMGLLGVFWLLNWLMGCLWSMSGFLVKITRILIIGFWVLWEDGSVFFSFLMKTAGASILIVCLKLVFWIFWFGFFK